jgi:hypothetical protein
LPGLAAASVRQAARHFKQRRCLRVLLAAEGNRPASIAADANLWVQR